MNILHAFLALIICRNSRRPRPHPCRPYMNDCHGMNQNNRPGFGGGQGCDPQLSHNFMQTLAKYLANSLVGCNGNGVQHPGNFQQQGPYQPNVFGPGGKGINRVCNSMDNLLGGRSTRPAECDLNNLNYGNMIGSFMKKPNHCAQQMNCDTSNSGQNCICFGGNNGYPGMGGNNGYPGMNGCNNGYPGMGGNNNLMNNNCKPGYGGNNGIPGMNNCRPGIDGMGNASTLPMRPPFNPCAGMGVGGNTTMPGFGSPGANSNCVSMQPLGCYGSHGNNYYDKCRQKKRRHRKRKHHDSSSS